MSTRKLSIHVDGATIGVTNTGAAAVARTPEGYFLGWCSRQMPRMTNNEAEYRAAMLGLDLAARLGARQVDIITDSEVVVRQMRGLSRVNSARLRPLHQETCQMVTRFDGVTFHHVSRDENKLADALAGEAVHGRLVRMRPSAPRESPATALFSLRGGGG